MHSKCYKDAISGKKSRAKICDGFKATNRVILLPLGLMVPC